MPPACHPANRRRLSAIGVACATIAVASISCAPDAAPPPMALPAPVPRAEAWFTDATDAWALTFRHENGARGDKHLVETMGAGACLLDIENDGDLDLYLVQSGGLDRAEGPDARNVLLRNDGNTAGRRFADISSTSGADDAGYGMGCVAADVEGDGDVDLFVTNWGPDVLLLNDGTGHFERAKDSGVEGAPEGWSTAAAFFDADGDDRLDLLVLSYVDYSLASEPRCTYPGSTIRAYCEPSLYRGARARLLRQVAPARFEDVTMSAGLTRSDGKGLGIAVLDADGDGDPDAFAANDTTPNFLWLNDTKRPGHPMFHEDGALRGLAYDREGLPQACMGAAVGDVDGNMSPEIFVTNFALETNTLYSQTSPGWWEDITTRTGLGPPSLPLLGFGTTFLDADLDGDLDLAVANGQINPEIADFDSTQSHAQPTHLYLNDGSGRFTLARSQALMRPVVGRGLIAVDLDGDGLLDLVLTQCGGPARLLLGTGANGHGIEDGVTASLALHQPGANRDAIGALVALTLPNGRRTARVVQRGESYLCASSGPLHFGLGVARTARVDITWPGGERTSHDIVPGLNQIERPAKARGDAP